MYHMNQEHCQFLACPGRVTPRSQVCQLSHEGELDHDEPFEIDIVTSSPSQQSQYNQHEM